MKGFLSARQWRNYGVMIVMLMGLLFTASCKKNEKRTGTETLHELYLMYKDGEINECQYNGQIIYKCNSGVYTEGATLYDQEFLKVGACNYTSGDVDAKCDMLFGCKTIYRGKTYYTGQPFVDEYGLSK